MPDPTSASLAALAAGLSTVTLALFGVDYYSLLYALIGALLALARSEQMGRGRAVAYVLLATLTGAVLGNLVAAQLLNPPRILAISACLVGGIVAQAFATVIFNTAPGLSDLAVKGFVATLRRLFGAKP
jgi:crotonobetainyl-CoA:carnitine CoA-transferase CaiB-like acyl-CoA transferase